MKMRFTIRLLITLFTFWLLPIGAFAVELIAHRGASYDAPENTLPAVQLAWQQAPEAVEVDIHLSRDGQIVVIHDGDTQRVAGRARRVVDQDLAELRQLDVGRWKGEKWEGTVIPTLAEVVATIPDGKRLFIEIKCGPEVAPELRRVIEASGKSPSHFAIISFNESSLRASKAALPDIAHYFLAGYRQNPDTGEYPKLEPLIELAREAGFDGLDLDYHWPLDRESVGQLHALGLSIYIYTVNDPEVARRLRDVGVDGITTDRPGWLREQLELEAAGSVMGMQ